MARGCRGFLPYSSPVQSRCMCFACAWGPCSCLAALGGGCMQTTGTVFTWGRCWSRCPPVSAAHVNVCLQVFCAFKHASLAERTAVNPQKGWSQALQSQGKASCWCCSILHEWKSAVCFWGETQEETFAKGGKDFLPPPCLHAQLLVPKAAQVHDPSQVCLLTCSPLVLSRNSPMSPSCPCTWISMWCRQKRLGFRPQPKWRSGCGQPALQPRPCQRCQTPA